MFGYGPMSCELSESEDTNALAHARMQVKVNISGPPGLIALEFGMRLRFKHPY